MDTKIIDFSDRIGFSKCVEAIKNNDIIVFPTETVYGIGGNALSKDVALKIFNIKNRAKDNPLIVHVSNYDISKYVRDVSSNTVKLIEKFWPGPLTIILEKTSVIPYEITGGRDTVAIRMPNNKIALKLIEESGCPIAAPSANISGRPSGTNANRCIEDFNGKVKFIIDGSSSDIGLESTVISMVNDEAIVFRPGYINLNDIRTVVPNVKMYDKLNEKILLKEPISPGLKYKHYAPKCEMVIVDATLDKTLNYLKDIYFRYNNIGILCVEENCNFYRNLGIKLNIIVVGKRFNLYEISKNLFESIRRFDDLNCDFILSECFFSDLTNAVMNRLLRASSNKLIVL